MKPWKSKPADVFNAAFAADVRALLAEFLSQKDLSFGGFKRAWKRLNFGVIHHSCPKLCEGHVFTQQLFDLTLRLLLSAGSNFLGLFSGLPLPSADAEVNRVLVQLCLVYLLYCLHATRRPLLPVKLSAQQAGMLVMTIRKLRCIRKHSRDACNLFARMVKRRAFHLSTRYLNDCESHQQQQHKQLQECWEEVAVYEANAEAWAKAIEGLGFRFGEIEQVQKKEAAAAAVAATAKKAAAAQAPQASASFLRRGVRGVQEPPPSGGARRTRREILEQTAEARAALLREREQAEALAEAEATAAAAAAIAEAEQPLLLPGMYRVSETAPPPAGAVVAEATPPPRVTPRRTEDEELLAMLEQEISSAEALLSESRQAEPPTRKKAGRKAQSKKAKAPREKAKPRERKRGRAPSEEHEEHEAAAVGERGEGGEGAAGGEVDDMALLNMLESEIYGAQQLLAANDRGERTTSNSRPQSKKNKAAATARKTTTTAKTKKAAPAASARQPRSTLQPQPQPRQAQQPQGAQTTDDELLASLEQQIAEADDIVAGESRRSAPSSSTSRTAPSQRSSSSTTRIRALDAVRNLVGSAPLDREQQPRQPRQERRRRSQSKERALQAVQKLLQSAILQHQREEQSPQPPAAPPQTAEQQPTRRRKTRATQETPRSPQPQAGSADDQLLAMLEQEIAGADEAVSRSRRRRN